LGNLKIWSAVVESHDIANSSYGVYNGQELMWEPRAWPLGSTGTAINFTGPFPQTVYAMGTYTLDPSVHSFDNLEVVTYVQTGTGTKEVLNASFIDLPDTATGTYEGSFTPVSGHARLFAGPNPCDGQFTVTSALPQGQTGTVSVYDLGGRMVQSFAAGGSINAVIEETGLYFVRLVTSSGLVENRQIAVVR